MPSHSSYETFEHSIYGIVRNIIGFRAQYIVSGSLISRDRFGCQLVRKFGPHLRLSERYYWVAFICLISGALITIRYVFEELRMRLVAPEPEISLYQDGFKGKDILDRAETGKVLSELVDEIEDPMVIALNGAWGCGKSFFLKCWVGAHSVENGGAATTVYFDAFAHDYLDDPLVAITGVIGDRFKSDAQSSKIWASAKTAAAKLWRPAMRIGLAVGTAGASEVAGAIVDAGLAAGSDELRQASEAFWRKEDGKRAAMGQFRSALSAVTAQSAGEAAPRKIVVVIDELDRCRPDYALAVLEVIKHFFAEPNVHFVLGVNLDELQNSVRSRYGIGVDADLYLQKFITLSMELPSFAGDRKDTKVEIKYFDEKSAEMGLNKGLCNHIRSYISRISPVPSVSIRGVQKLLTQIALTPQVARPFDTMNEGWKIFIAGLIVLKTWYPDAYKSIVDGNINKTDIQDFFKLGDKFVSKGDVDGKVFTFIWDKFIDPYSISDHDQFSGILRGFHVDDPEASLRRAIDSYLEAIIIRN